MSWVTVLVKKSENAPQNAKNNLLKTKRRMNIKMSAKEGPVFTFGLPRGAARPMPPVCYTTVYQHACLPGRQHMHTFWRWWLASQSCRSWREEVPRRIPVRRRSWGIITYSVCH